jgi:hypothetical protein
MAIENIEQVADVGSPRSVNESKVKHTKKLRPDLKMCVFYKDMECRIPVCDMKACGQCNEGYVYCTRVNFIKDMLQKIFLFLLMFILFTD